MELLQLKCPNCGANLENEDELESFYCKYCGTKIILANQQPSAIKAKAKIAVTNKLIEQRRYEMEREDRNRNIERAEKEKEQERSERSNLKVLFICVVLLIICMIGLDIIQKEEEKKHIEKVEYLQTLENEIAEAIKNEDFDTATILTNKLYCDDGYSTKETEAWDNKRRGFLQIIEQKRREVDLRNPDNIIITETYSSLLGKKYKEIVDYFSALGFTDISTQQSTEPAGLFKNRKNTVEHIVIGGKTEFYSGDYFHKDTKIIIYYYTK